MKMTRRDFLKWMIASGVALGMGKMDIAKAESILDTIKFVPVIWLQAAGCSGCTIAFLDMVENEVDTVYTVEDLLVNKIDLKYHSTLMTAAASECMEILDAEYKENGYILVVEGGIPTAENGAYCVIGERDNRPLTALQALKDFAVNASSIIAIGTCSAYKGVSGAGGNVTSVKAVDEILTEYSNKIINLPGCPVQPYIIGGTIAKLLAGETLAKDSKKRPTAFYSASNLHARADTVTGKANCPLKTQGRASTLGTCGKCFENMGCRGRDSESKVTCYTKLWGMDWTCKEGCFGAGSMCIGCSSPNFPFTTYTTGTTVPTSSSIYNFRSPTYTTT